MTIRIVTDSTCDLPPEVAAELGITVIPDYINVGEESFLDGVDLTRHEFYQRLVDWPVPPTTAAPGVDAFCKVYDRLAAEGASQVISFHIYEKLSNLSNVAHLAAEATRSVAVNVVTGGFLSLGGGFIISAAARAARAGQSLAEIMQVVQDTAHRTHIFAALDTLEYLRRSGRVSNLMARVGSWFHILPVLKVHLEEIDMDMVRTRASGMARVIYLVEALGPIERLGILHSNAPEKAQQIRRQASHLFPPGKEPWVVDITPVIGTHVGPGAVGLAVVQAAKAD
jgi:DegV family protein with EDD domain